MHIGEVCSDLLLFDSEGTGSLLCDLNWAEYAVQLGYKIGSFDKTETRVVACITCPETPLTSLLIGFGCLLATDQSDADPDLVTFAQFMELEPTQQLYWFDEKRERVIVAVIPMSITMSSVAVDGSAKVADQWFSGKFPPI